jgi:hypothetical protein
MIQFLFRYTGPRPKGVHKHLKIAWRDAGILWHQRMRGKHFTQRGAAEYHYQYRSKKYTAVKRRKHGHKLPLVFTGRSRMLTRMRDVRPTAKGVRVVMRAPALNFRPKGWTHTMREEMTRVSQGEAKQLATRFGRFMAKRLKADRTTETTRIG